MTSPDLAAALAELADIAAIKGDELDARRLRRAAAAIPRLEPEQIVRLPLLARKTRLPDPASEIDPAVVPRLLDMSGGRIDAVLRAARRALPRDLRHLIEQTGMETHRLVSLAARRAIGTSGDLSAALLDPDDAVAPELRGILSPALDELRAGRRRLTLGRAVATLESVRAALELQCPAATFTPAGSVRRFEPTVGDLDVLAVAEDPAQVLSAIAGMPLVVEVLYHNAGRLSVQMLDEQIDIRAVTPANAGPAFIHYTGSAAHIRQLRGLAERRGMTLSSTDLVEGRRATRAHTEEDVYGALGLPWIPPELREGTGEIEAARGGRWPRLLEPGDIRGDLHMHSEWSDGRDSVRTMVLAARALGYEYVAMTDHSQSSAALRVLTPDRLARQAEEIASLRSESPGITILHGAEVDILPDGRLDFSDALLEPLDIVLASLHDAAGQSPARLMERYLRAMRHPLVNVITHPRNRLVGRAAGYDLDYDALFEAAVETGTLLEIDGAPLHLDMDGALARRAVRAGVTVSVSSDCHRAEALGRQMQLGVGTARRGWVEARHVVNTRPLEEVRAFVTTKRLRGA